MSSFLSRAHGLYTGVFAAIEKSLGGDVLAVLARLTLAGIFWRSLLTKVETVKLFKYTEYINDFPVERAHVRLPDSRYRSVRPPITSSMAISRYRSFRASSLP